MRTRLIEQRAESTEPRGKGRSPSPRGIFNLASFFVLFALGSVLNAEIIDRVLAILPGQIVTLSDVEAALDFGLVEPPSGADRIAGGLSALVDRMLMLNEVRRVVPPEPRPAAIDARIAQMRQQFRSPEEFSRALSARGVDEAVLRLYAADDLRLASYLDERFSSAAQPTEEELRKAGEAAKEALTSERRGALIGAWVAELRRRADVTVLP